MKIRVDEDFMRAHFGTFQTIDCETELLPDNPLMVGSRMENARATSITCFCAICHKPTLLDTRDLRILQENPGMVIVCPDCFLVCRPSIEEEPKNG